MDKKQKWLIGILWVMVFAIGLVLRLVDVSTSLMVIVVYFLGAIVGGLVTHFESMGRGKYNFSLFKLILNTLLIGSTSFFLISILTLWKTI